MCVVGQVCASARKMPHDTRKTPISEKSAVSAMRPCLVRGFATFGSLLQAHGKRLTRPGPRNRKKRVSEGRKLRVTRGSGTKVNCTRCDREKTKVRKRQTLTGFMPSRGKDWAALELPRTAFLKADVRMPVWPVPCTEVMPTPPIRSCLLGSFSLFLPNEGMTSALTTAGMAAAPAKKAPRAARRETPSVSADIVMPQLRVAAWVLRPMPTKAEGAAKAAAEATTAEATTERSIVVM
mmetsp:Transcript_50333/g.81285  ORF Transcript_50333/g.81285 Transcript_50333/m.81285 type:complete len:237 (-) Transcript_50333:17-727(-)